MSSEETKFIFCKECGAKNNINANFCTTCGTKLVKPAENPAPVVLPTIEEPVIEEPVAEAPVAEESTPVEAPEVIAEDEAPAPDEEEPETEEKAEEETVPAIIPVVIPQAEEPSAEESAKEEERNEEPEPEDAPVIIAEETEPEAPAAEATAQEPEEKTKAEEAVPAVVPVAPKVSKKEAKLEKKLEEAKKQAQEQARKEAEKAEEKAKKAEAKAEKAEAKARKAEEKTKAKSSTEPAKSNSHYYYNHEAGTAAAKAAPEKPKKKRRQNFFLKILSFLLSLILLASLAVAVPITLLNLFLTDHNIDVIVDHAVSSIELDKIEFSTADGTKTLSSALHDITNEFEGWDHITEEQINDALLEDFVKQFVSDALAQLGMSLKEGEAMLGWTPEQIYDFIEANKDTIEQLARDAGYDGKFPIEEKKEMMIANIEEKIGKDGISASALLGNAEETEQLARYLDAAQALFSRNTLYLAWGLVAFIVILLIFTNIGYFGAFCRACGFPTFIIGGIYFLAGLGVTPVLSILNLPIIPIVASAVEFTAGFLGAMLMDISIVVIGVGLVLIIISYISDAIRRKKDSKKNA